MKQGFVQEDRRPRLLSVKRHISRGSQKFQPLPQPTGSAPYHLALGDLFSKNEIQKITDDKSITFHCLGDTGGVKDPVPQQLVANGIENTNASFFYHLGDVVYYNGESQHIRNESSG